LAAALVEAATLKASVVVLNERVELVAAVQWDA
jgi:hypothetical protein